jgi:DNA (cytosine-5)-methyltransferase 1
MSRPRLLDLFCGAGGCSVGYHRAGFEVVGVDLLRQPNYPFEFWQADALEYLAAHGRGFDAVHASPPCQRYTVGRHIHGSDGRHPDLVAACRAALIASGRPWVIENVPGSPLVQPVTLCGLMFGLGVLRHRLFESSALLFAPAHPRHPASLTTGTLTAKRGGRGNGYSTGEHGLVCVAGNNFVREAGARAMGVGWPMTRRELANAIPPAYAEWVGRQLIALLQQNQPQPTEAA